jgi:hypothetical protein
VGRSGSGLPPSGPKWRVAMICFTPNSATTLVEALRGRSAHLIRCGTIWRNRASVRHCWPPRLDPAGWSPRCSSRPTSAPGWSPIGPLGNLDRAVQYAVCAGQQVAIEHRRRADEDVKLQLIRSHEGLTRLAPAAWTQSCSTRSAVTTITPRRLPTSTCAIPGHHWGPSHGHGHRHEAASSTPGLFRDQAVSPFSFSRR